MHAVPLASHILWRCSVRLDTDRGQREVLDVARQDRGIDALRGGSDERVSEAQMEALPARQVAPCASPKRRVQTWSDELDRLQERVQPGQVSWTRASSNLADDDLIDVRFVTRLEQGTKAIDCLRQASHVIDDECRIQQELHGSTSVVVTSARISSTHRTTSSDVRQWG